MRKEFVLLSNTMKHISEEKHCHFLTLDVDKTTVDGVIGLVYSLTAVPAAVFSGQNGNLVYRVIAVSGDNMHRIFIVWAKPLKGDWRSAFNATDQGKFITLRDFCQVWEDDQGRFRERHCGEEELSEYWRCTLKALNQNDCHILKYSKSVGRWAAAVPRVGITFCVFVDGMNLEIFKETWFCLLYCFEIKGCLLANYLT